MTRVHIAVLNQGWLCVSLANFLIQVTHDSRFVVKIVYPSEKSISHNRNVIVKKFLEESDFEWLLMIDSDVVPLKNVLELALLDIDVVAAPCPQWQDGDVYWVVMDRVEDGYRAVPVERRAGLQEVDAVGTGCIMIKRRVLEVIKAPFERKWDNNGIMEKGLDFYFCDKAKAAGFGVYAHWNYPCDHIKEVGIVTILKLLTKDK